MRVFLERNGNRCKEVFDYEVKGEILDKNIYILGKKAHSKLKALTKMGVPSVKHNQFEYVAVMNKKGNTTVYYLNRKWRISENPELHGCNIAFFNNSMDANKVAEFIKWKIRLFWLRLIGLAHGELERCYN